MTKEELSYFKDKKILVTGHTGFKGSWLCRILGLAGASVVGYSLAPEKEALYPMAAGRMEQSGRLRSVIADIRDYETLLRVMQEEQPEFVLHMAAQPIVRTSYEKPRYTYETNVMGTVNLCEAVRQTASVRSFLNVTTDKVYKNEERGTAFREEEPLDGYDPYSNSKSCSELVTHSYVNSFFKDRGLPTSTARAGNVIGGGDFARDRIVPDCVRTALSGTETELCKPVIKVRNPYSIRPFQHVLEPLFMYLTILRAQELDPAAAGAYNIGPEDADCVTTGDLVTRFCDAWNRTRSKEEAELSWENVGNVGPHEAAFLKLDCSLARKVFGWKPVWNIDRALAETVAWTRVYSAGGDIESEMNREIEAFYGESE